MQDRNQDRPQNLDCPSEFLADAFLVTLDRRGFFVIKKPNGTQNNGNA